MIAAAGWRAHQAGQGPRRICPAADRQPPERARPRQQLQANAAQDLRREKVRQQRAVEEVDQSRAARHVNGAGLRVGAERFGAADIARRRPRLDHAIAEGGNVAQAEVEALGPDRRQDVGGLPNERNPVRRHLGGAKPSQWKERARADALDRAQKALQAVFEQSLETGFGKLGKSGDFVGGFDPDQARGQPRQRHGGERPSAAMQLGGDAGVWASVTKTAGERRLWIIPGPHGDGGGGAHDGMAPVGGHHEPRQDPAALGQAKADGGVPEFPPRNAFLETIHRAQFQELPTGYHALSSEEIAHIRRDPGASRLLPRQEVGVRASSDERGTSCCIEEPARFVEMVMNLQPSVRSGAESLQLVGEDAVAFGSDFDGGPTLARGMRDVRDLPMITEAMLSRGYSEVRIRKFWGDNLRRALSQATA